MHISFESIFISEHIRMNFGIENSLRCAGCLPSSLYTPFILHSVTTSRTSNTHQLVVGMTVHEILDMVAYVHMYVW